MGWGTVTEGFQEVKKQQKRGLKRENQKEHTKGTSGVPQDSPDLKSASAQSVLCHGAWV